MTIEGPPETVDEGMNGFRDRNLPTMLRAGGALTCSSTALAARVWRITLWDTQEDAEATERIAARFREVSAREREAGSPPTVELYDSASSPDRARAAISLALTLPEGVSTII